MNKDEAVHEFVRGMNAVPRGLLETLYGNEDMFEITPPKKNDAVRITSDADLTGTIKKYLGEKLYLIETEDGTRLKLRENEFEVLENYEYGYLPMWGTLWSFESQIDEWWLKEEDGLCKMADCGFRIYDTPFGYYFGIDGAGYDFYEAHWEPLYEARGLHWHAA